MSDKPHQSWVRKAESDLLAADNNLASERIPFDAVCFHCQQGAEKYLKGLLAYFKGEVLRIHDLLALLESIKQLVTTGVPDAIRDACIILNPYAIEVRYPDDDWSPTADDAQEARTAVESIRTWVKSLVHLE